MDMWAGEILLRLKEQPEYEDIELFLVLPFKGHDAGWDERSKNRLTFLREHCTGITVAGTEDRAMTENYKLRGKYMVDQADSLVVVYDNEPKSCSDTGMIFDYAKQKGLRIILIHPDTAQVKELSTNTGM